MPSKSTVILMLAIVAIVAIFAHENKQALNDLQVVDTVSLYPINETIPANAGSLIVGNVYYRTDQGVVSNIVHGTDLVYETTEVSPCYKVIEDGLGRQYIAYFVPPGEVDLYLQYR